MLAFFIYMLADGYYSLGADINKVKSDKTLNENEQGVTGELLEELELDMSDDELIQLKKKWEKSWEGYEKEIIQLQTENEIYWMGKQHPGFQYKPTERPQNDNLIFESLETYLPLATKNNPEPVVDGDGTEQGTEIATTVQKYLISLADTLRLKMHIKQVARNWALYLLGVAKVGWSYVENEITLTTPRPQKLILDPDGTINASGEYDGSYIGEIRKDTARVLLTRFGKTNESNDQGTQAVGVEEAKRDNLDEAGQHIWDECQGKLGTEIQYQEWWTPDKVFWTLKQNVLGKFKNPHFNYEGKPQVMTDPTGQQTQMMAQPQNHFKVPKMPYIFLSVFNLGKHPHDDTSLITQNLANQDVINKRQRQIDKNVDWMNGGWAVSGERSGLTRDEAANAIEAARKGGGLWIPQGDVNGAVVPLNRPGLPADVFNHLQDIRTEVRNSFGTRGSTPAGTQSEQTVRGKLIVKGQDGDRIGGGVSEYLEVFSKQVYDWFVQLVYVYYDEEHKATIVGEAGAREQIALSGQSINSKLTVNVKTGSMIPKDSLTKANQAVDLFGAQALDPLTLYERLEFPNPREAATRLLLYHANLQGYIQKYFPELQQLFQPQPQAEKLPSESINYKDLPPEGQSAMLQKVGIQVAPQDIAVNAVAQEVIKHAGKPQVQPAANAQLQAGQPGPMQAGSMPKVGLKQTKMPKI